MNYKTKRKFSSQFKAQLVLEYIKGNKSQSELCREHVINPNLLNKWRQHFQDNFHQIFENQNQDRQEQEIAKLERIIGKLTIENDFLKRARSLLSP